LLNPFVLVLVVSKSDPARNGMLRVTSFASECWDFAWPARTAIGGHACALELFLESTENATRNGVASIRTFSSMSVETSLKAAAVERHQREKANVEIVEATHVDCNRLCALRCPPA
jgi:N-acyl-L-homoserine lactone synthetase